MHWLERELEGKKKRASETNQTTSEHKNIYKLKEKEKVKLFNRVNA